ncbi:hypothetical protein [Pseudaminobacter sp. NGMCC 1.201702]|uniref:hypothetical protein n=1 Tax=Pseudaminobacter sp. NGMCC 1.201702 TaxID=3391825 RepID=UPI0039EEC926
MMIARKMFSAAAVLAAAATIAGCMSAGPGGGGPIAAATPRGVEGNWFDPNGIRSNFSGGVFETRTTDTNQKLADGSYRMIDARNVEITMNSLVRQTTSNVNCLLVSPNQLNCTSASGQQFVLTRSPAVG